MEKKGKLVSPLWRPMHYYEEVQNNPQASVTTERIVQDGDSEASEFLPSMLDGAVHDDPVQIDGVHDDPVHYDGIHDDGIHGTGAVTGNVTGNLNIGGSMDEVDEAVDETGYDSLFDEEERVDQPVKKNDPLPKDVHEVDSLFDEKEAADQPMFDEPLPKNEAVHEVDSLFDEEEAADQIEPVQNAQIVYGDDSLRDEENPADQIEPVQNAEIVYGDDSLRDEEDPADQIKTVQNAEVVYGDDSLRDEEQATDQIEPVPNAEVVYGDDSLRDEEDPADQIETVQNAEVVYGDDSLRDEEDPADQPVVQNDDGVRPSQVTIAIEEDLVRDSAAETGAGFEINPGRSSVETGVHIEAQAIFQPEKSRPPTHAPSERPAKAKKKKKKGKVVAMGNPKAGDARVVVKKPGIDLATTGVAMAGHEGAPAQSLRAPSAMGKAGEIGSSETLLEDSVELEEVPYNVFLGFTPVNIGGATTSVGGGTSSTIVGGGDSPSIKESKDEHESIRAKAARAGDPVLNTENTVAYIFDQPAHLSRQGRDSSRGTQQSVKPQHPESKMVRTSLPAARNMENSLPIVIQSPKGQGPKTTVLTSTSTVRTTLNSPEPPQFPPQVDPQRAFSLTFSDVSDHFYAENAAMRDSAGQGHAPGFDSHAEEVEIRDSAGQGHAPGFDSQAKSVPIIVRNVIPKAVVHRSPGAAQATPLNVRVDGKKLSRVSMEDIAEEGTGENLYAGLECKLHARTSEATNKMNTRDKELSEENRRNAETATSTSGNTTTSKKTGFPLFASRKLELESIFGAELIERMEQERQRLQRTQNGVPEYAELVNFAELVRNTKKSVDTMKKEVGVWGVQVADAGARLQAREKEVATREEQIRQKERSLYQKEDILTAKILAAVKFTERLEEKISRRADQNSREQNYYGEEQNRTPTTWKNTLNYVGKAIEGSSPKATTTRNVEEETPTMRSESRTNSRTDMERLWTILTDFDREKRQDLVFCEPQSPARSPISARSRSARSNLARRIDNISRKDFERFESREAKGHYSPQKHLETSELQTKRTRSRRGPSRKPLWKPIGLP